MNHALPSQRLKEVFDQAALEVTWQAGGIRLKQTPGASPPEGEVCTVCISFQRGFQSTLTLCAETSLLTRLTQFMMGRKEVLPQDVEDFTKEYFNILCGHIVSKLFHQTKIAARFGLPSFYRGRYRPEGTEIQFTLGYVSSCQDRLLLTHHVCAS